MEKKKAVIVNFFAGPGTGKSTTSASTFSKLKKIGVDCELVTEYAKDKVWEEAYKVFESQVYIFGKQYHRLNRVADKVDCIITDAPLLFSIIYNDRYKALDNLVLECHKEFNCINVFLKRSKEYNPNGRIQTYEEACELDTKIKDMLNTHNIPYIELDTTEASEGELIEIILQTIKNRLNAVDTIYANC